MLTLRVRHLIASGISIVKKDIGIFFETASHCSSIGRSTNNQVTQQPSQLFYDFCKYLTNLKRYIMIY
ncbi:unnamed protein product [Acanthoscelides obtectus]|uniref:Uncharacterized protein n=1 Tax=Acanthoscelides obtectus TaxID=200917 RepID=A0A9P0PC29_ACAOB|nr:unnamed protein product [Acanthoscelides obtectus]CAK1631842.1 hypothetical protein AOBTE_LOCUS7195 [Acanthoscelides obtectus]